MAFYAGSWRYKQGGGGWDGRWKASTTKWIAGTKIVSLASSVRRSLVCQVQILFHEYPHILYLTSFEIPGNSWNKKLAENLTKIGYLIESTFFSLRNFIPIIERVHVLITRVILFFFFLQRFKKPGVSNFYYNFCFNIIRFVILKPPTYSNNEKLLDC